MNNKKKYIVEVRVPAEHIFYVSVEAENEHDAKSKVENLSIVDICSNEHDTETDWAATKYSNGTKWIEGEEEE